MKAMTGTISVNSNGHSAATNVLARLVAFSKNLSWRLERQRGRTQLADLTDEALRDIGITRQQARSAAAKHLFQD